MPTFYNFRNKNDYLRLKFPNISTSGRRLFLLGDQNGMAPGPNQVNAAFRFANTSVVSLNSSNLSPGKENEALRITPVGINNPWQAIDLYVGLTPRPDNLDYVGSSIRTYRASFSYRANASSIGKTFSASITYSPFGGAGSISGGTGGEITIVDTNWRTATVSFVRNQAYPEWVAFSGFTALFPRNTWTSSDWIEIADFEFTWDEQPVTTTSFDDQFIPADTFRQGNLLTWGGTTQSGNPSRNLTIGAPVQYDVYYSSPLVIQSSTNKSWKHVSQWSKNLSVALDGNGKAWYWGYNQGFPNITTAASITASTPVLSNSGYTWLTMQTQSYEGNLIPVKSFGAGIRVDGTLWTWGANDYGQLGIGVTTPTLTLVQEFTSSSNWKSLSLSETAIHAIKSDGTLWCWGRNYGGMLATNDLVDRWSPTQEFTSSSNWKYVDAGIDAVCAIKTDGTLWGWGRSINGVGANEGLPSGTADKSRPFRENTLSTNWKTVSVGGDSILGDAIVALKTDGTAWAWGIFASSNSSGGTRATPTSIANEPGLKWRDISGGYNQVFLISTDSSLWGFGANEYFNLTNSDNNFRATPIPIFNISKVKRVETNPGFFASSNVRVLTYIDPVI